ncbi:MAG TPA: putative sporulation protein YtxC [Bacillota bacterium]|nr:putative sporulation protein YtxC [Bacillota bacterium]
MEIIAIGVPDHESKARERLLAKIRTLAERGIHVDITERSLGSLTFLCFSISDLGQGIPAGQRDMLLYHVASALADNIVFDVETELIGKILRTRYSYFDDAEREKIAEYALDTLNRRSQVDDQGQVQAINRRRNDVLFTLLDYLDTNDCLILEGFMRFRLKHYMEQIENAADSAVDDFMLEKEYNEFIRLLKYFVDVQEPKIEEIHVISRPNGRFRLLDQNGKAVDSDCLEGMPFEPGQGDIDHEDLLISTLITASPKRIVLHGFQDKNANETIFKVFDSRVSTCSGCHLCEKSLARLHAPIGGHSDDLT